MNTALRVSPPSTRIRVNGEAMEGMVDLPGGKGMAKWTAVRTAEAKVVME